MGGSIKVIAFDADDTLWVNEPYFQHAEKQFCVLMEDFLPQHAVSKALYQTEMEYLPLYGYGVKGFILCMIETAYQISGGTLKASVIPQILEFGKELLRQPIELLEGVATVLEKLQPDYRLVVATKGDLLDQERKLKKSGLEHYFHHIEIMSDKQVPDYEKLIKHLDISPSEFLMIGNSIKSDVLPVLELGGHAVHLPYHTTWTHEQVDYTITHERFYAAQKMLDVLNLSVL